MNKFLTLLKRDISDNKGALIITPLVIAAFILSIAVLGMLFGKFNYGDGGFNFDARNSGEAHAQMNVDGKSFQMRKDASGILVMDDGHGNLRPVVQMMNPEDKQEATQIFVIASAFGAAIPLWVAGISVLFVLASSLFDERKEKSIMFWKSLPVSDLQTAVAKMVSIVGGGLGFAVLVSMALHFALICVTLLGLSIYGVNLLDFGAVFSAYFAFWGIALVALLVWFLWTLPAHGWFLLSSSFSPKAPFLTAILPIALLPVLGKIFFRGDIDVFLIPLRHLMGEPVFSAIGNSARGVRDPETVAELSQTVLPAVLNTLTEPSVWVGVAVAAGLIYAASEVRRRHAL
jgi:ABC-2 type transport system permease protein